MQYSGWTVAFVVSALIVATVAAAVGYGSYRWRSETEDMHGQMEAGRTACGLQIFHASELRALPAPVRKYFAAALVDGQPIISSVRLEQAGSFNMSESGERWQSFTARQRVITRRPGFDWEARIAVAPGLSAWVHDAYIRGDGRLHASLLGLFTLARMGETPEMASSELMRFVAEAVWYPTVLLPSQGVRWEAVDDRSARAIFEDSGTTVNMLFTFGASGLIESFRAERGRMVRGKVVITPWEGRVGQYEVRDGMHIPLEGEVAWLLPGGRLPYWRGKIVKVSYEFDNGMPVRGGHGR